MENKKFNWSGVTVDTITRALFLFLSLLNMVLKFFNLVPVEISETEIYNFVSALAVVLSALWGFWKDNPFTLAAQQGHAVTKSLKDDIEEEDLDIDVEEEI